MVLESLLDPRKISKSYIRLGVVGAFYAIVAGLLAYYMFRDNASIVMVFFTVMACIPFMYSLMKAEENKEESLLTEKSFMSEYGHVLMGLLTLFIGVTLGYLALFLIVSEPVQATLFSAQQSAITSINGRITFEGPLADIFINNLSVLGLSIVFAFLYGFGAITIIVWNSSVVAAAIGNFMVAKGGMAVGLWAFIRYMIHGIPEIAAYLIAGLAGGIISVAIINHDIGTKKWKKVVIDAMQLVVLSILLIMISALIEVFVTPWLY
jgi:uncharacterized membrane protein SpoIIM required for sporulation